MNTIADSASKPALRDCSLPRAARKMLDIVDRIESGRVEVTLPDGRRSRHGASGPEAQIRFADWAVFADIARRGDVGFGEAYMAGRWHSPDLAALLKVLALNRRALDRAIYGGWVGRILLRIHHLRNANTRRNSRRNIARHYDLGNDFYRLWLDPSMTYSSALFAGVEDGSLLEAQSAKNRRVLQQLEARPGASILEIGCGWGGFAEMALEQGHRLVGLSLSNEQLSFARARLAERGLLGRASLEYRDYRDVYGRFDHVVSIEMIEAVGERYWPLYFERIAAVLAPQGRAVIQAITIDDGLFERYRRGTDFVQQYIFPGGMLASAERLRVECERAGLRVVDEFAFGLDYARTLRLWRERFLANRAGCQALGFDDAFVRMWEFYLAYCEAGFHARCTDVRQLTLVRA